jgi:hypothetical protein
VDGVRGESQRWQGPKSSFPWEQEALDYIRGLMPEAEPYRAWQTFTFTAASGHVREVDLFIATPGGLFLVEIKSHPGGATNNGSTWLFRDGNTTRTIENPLHFTDLKCKELKSQLERAARDLKIREPVPRIEPVVFLSAQTLVCRFDDFQRPRVFGRDDRMASTTLGGIWRDFLNQPPASERNRVTPSFSRQLPKLMQKTGIAKLHRARKVGPYELDPKSFDNGPTWADYLASNPSLPNDYPRRVRVYLTEQGATEDDRKSTQRAARREYLALQDISHDGIVRAEQFSDELRDGPAVVFRHGTGWQRLDHFMASRTEDGLPLETRLEMMVVRFGVPQLLESWLLTEHGIDNERVEQVKTVMLPYIAVFHHDNRLTQFRYRKVPAPGAEVDLFGAGSLDLRLRLMDPDLEFGYEKWHSPDFIYSEPELRVMPAKAKLEISAEINEWTRHGIRELLRRLTQRNLLWQADVIRTAASGSDGRVPREQVLQLGRRHGRANLNRLIRPIGAVLEELESEGVVASHVMAPLRSVKKGGKVSLYEVPKEFIELMRHTLLER